MDDIKPCPNCDALMNDGDVCPECDHDERDGDCCCDHCASYEDDFLDQRDFTADQ